MTRRVPSAQNKTKLISDKLFEIHRAISTWSLDELRAVDQDILALDDKNCCWFTHRLKGSIRSIVLLAIKEKEDESRRASEILGDKLV